mmetsp:Transcript_21089/g.41367  ORF Transcript_21089/g.41367 Transcript_21089/m.41367 type:complete len:1010 (-) Transcript_21089:314-3343(-)|eukprot:CAMPEP_0171499346 /NCGR_PEP_ID=MMETSP0958-20121227/8383_1 /TAXON_ID=87120 /ORGANISM="Aurantiochytrium limacinum, Strain ATCCMYA-1381" /LENGTH=1009 /DNA_ID=CAMNT_0012033903 /DNA_START=682 /DNA_END=3711 /DNA_ORIENTATION=+
MTRVTRTRSGAAKTGDRQGLQLDAPVFRPTIEEFEDFESFVAKIEEAGSKYGLVKVVPPKEWGWKMHPNPFLARTQELKRGIKPVRQFSSGRKGAYRIDLVETKKRPVGDFWEESLREDAKRESLVRQPEQGVAMWQGKWESSTTNASAAPREEKKEIIDPTLAETALSPAGKDESTHPSDKEKQGPVQPQQVETGEKEQPHVAAQESKQAPIPPLRMVLTGNWAANPKALDEALHEQKNATASATMESEDKEADDSSQPSLSTFTLNLEAFDDEEDTLVDGAMRFRGKGRFIDQDNDGEVREDFCVLYLVEHLVENARATVEDCRTKEFAKDYHLEGYGANGKGMYRLMGELNQARLTKPCESEPASTFWLSCTYLDSTEGGSPKRRKVNDEDTESILEKSLVEKAHEARKLLEFEPEKMQTRVEKQDLDRLEAVFWKEVGSHSKPSMYGSDQEGTLFGDVKELNAGKWNLDKLDTILRVGFAPGREAKGITTSMLYFGMWRAMFAWHTEDMELNSVNFLHYGAAKFWYAVPPEHAGRLEIVSRGEFGGEANICPEFLRHKNVMMAPSVLIREKIPFVRAVQRVGEFMFTFPRAYHGGFNLGFNVAEASNFATPRWLTIGRRARWCKCEHWTFRLDIDDFVERVRAKAPERLPPGPYEGDRILYRYDANNLVPCPTRRKSKSKSKSGHSSTPKTMMLIRVPREEAAAEEGTENHERVAEDTVEDTVEDTAAVDRANEQGGQVQAAGDSQETDLRVTANETSTKILEHSNKMEDTESRADTLPSSPHRKAPDMRTALMRVIKGKNGAPFMVVPVNWDEVPFERAPFYPDEDDWSWPQPGEVDATDDEACEMVTPPSTKPSSAKKVRLENAVDSDDDIPMSKEDQQQRRDRWENLRWTRRQRIIVRKAKVLHQANPLVFAYMLALVEQDENSSDPEAVSRAMQHIQQGIQNQQLLMKSAMNTHIPRPVATSTTISCLPPERVKILEAFKNSRAKRLKMRRERARLAKVST